MLDLDGAEHSKCNHMMVLGFKGLRGKLVTDPKIVRVYKVQLQVRSYGRLGGRAFKEMFCPQTLLYVRVTRAPSVPTGPIT